MGNPVCKKKNLKNISENGLKNISENGLKNISENGFKNISENGFRINVETVRKNLISESLQSSQTQFWLNGGGHSTWKTGGTFPWKKICSQPQLIEILAIKLQLRMTKNYINKLLLHIYLPTSINVVLKINVFQ